MNISSGSGSELIQIADAVAKEKLIDPKLVIDAMEESLAKLQNPNTVRNMT